MTRRVRIMSAGLALIALGAGASGCSNSESTASAAEDSGIGAGARDTAEAVEVDPDVEGLVPGEIAQAGEFTVVIDPTYAPMEFTDDDGEIVGVEPDMLIAVANKMGIDVAFERGAFDGQIAGIRAGRYDLSAGSNSVTEDRLKVLSMVSYLNSGTSVMVASENPADIAATIDLCGKTVAALTGTTQNLTTLPALQEECAAADEEEIDELILSQQDNVNQAVASGRADAMLADNALVAYYAQVRPDAFASIDSILVDPAPLGFMINKADGDFGKAIAAGLNSLIEDGTYSEILKSWGMEASAVDEAEAHLA
jgi:polar amino acid transport system substrate-binding protein